MRKLFIHFHFKYQLIKLKSHHYCLKKLFNFLENKCYFDIRLFGLLYILSILLHYPNDPVRTEEIFTPTLNLK